MSERGRLDRPIFIIGAARSGTTITGELLGRHADVTYWIEPKYIWRYRAAHAETDVRAADEATPAVARYIRRRFEARVAREGRSRFAEKTPSNCLRIPFIDRVFPDGLFLNLERDGRDAVLSSYKRWTGLPSKSAIRRRITNLEIPLRDAPLYLVDILRDVVWKQLRPQTGNIWGPHIPELRRLRREHGVLATAAIQWSECVRTVRADLAEIPAERQLTVRYEDLVADPAGQLARILQFLDLRPDAGLCSHAAATVRTDSVGRWRQADRQDLAKIEPLVAGAMADLGYSTSS